MEIIIPFFAGLSYALAGIGHKITSTYGNVTTIQNAAFCSVCGVVLFGIRGTTEFATFSPDLLILAVIIGVTQYLGMIFLNTALKIGPLSPAWCAISLVFMPAVIFSAVVFGEPLTQWHIVSLIFICCAIYFASGNGKQQKEMKGWRAKLLYGTVLSAMLLSCSLCSIGLKVAFYHHVTGHEQTLLAESKELLMGMMYLCLGICCCIHLTLTKTWVFNRAGWTGGALVSVCTLGAYLLQLMIMELPAAIVFAMTYSVSVLVSGILSTVFFREKRTLNWYLTLVCAVTAILLMLL